VEVSDRLELNALNITNDIVNFSRQFFSGEVTKFKPHASFGSSTFATRHVIRS
jgi:hypothetical protein